MKIYGKDIDPGNRETQCIDWDVAGCLGLTGRHTIAYDLISEILLNGCNVFLKRYMLDSFEDYTIVLFGKCIRRQDDWSVAVEFEDERSL